MRNSSQRCWPHRRLAHRVLDVDLAAAGRLEMALWTRQREAGSPDGRLDGLIHHSDAGSQFTSIRYADRLADAGAIASIGRVGDSYDNAQVEA